MKVISHGHRDGLHLLVRGGRHLHIWRKGWRLRWRWLS
jgi:hypothetical protein